MEFTDRDRYFMTRAIELSELGMNQNAGGPFGCVVVKNNQIIAEGYNQVTSTNDPTAHAEMVAIREACKRLNTFQLEDCMIYTSCEPCPMCFGAIYWARPKKVYYACNLDDAAEVGFDDGFIKVELNKPKQEREIEFVGLMREKGVAVFHQWLEKADKKEY